MDPAWIEHRRGADGELLGWMLPADDGFVAIDRLGRTRTGVVGWLEAEKALDALGLGYLADPYELLENGEWLRVRITEVSTHAVRVKKEDWGAIGGTPSFHTLAFPAPAILRPHRR